jgi:hypothetical protein
MQDARWQRSERNCDWPAFVGPLEAFAAANAESCQPLYRLAIASMAAEPVETGGKCGQIAGKYGYPTSRLTAPKRQTGTYSISRPLCVFKKTE